MSKSINTSVDNCRGCPYSLDCEDGRTEDKILFNFQCILAKKRIGGWNEVTEKTPIPKWCPLPDSESMRYFRVREEMDEIDDNTAVYHKSIESFKIEQETWILGWDKENTVLVDNLNDVSELKNTIVVIYGRIILEEEVDLDRGNTHRSRREE